MQYFKKELWSDLNNCDEAVRVKAEEVWNRNDHLYQQKFEEIKKLLPRHFTKEYLKRNGFHDYIILRIDFSKKGRTYSCELQLTNGIENILIIMSEVKLVQVDVTSFQYCILGKLMWGFSEFEITPDGNIRMSVLCDIQNEMRFEFEDIKFVKQS